MPAPVVRLSHAQSPGSTGVATLIATAQPRTPLTRIPTAAELDAMARITAAKLRRLANNRVSAENIAAYAAALETHRRRGEINTPLRVSHFLAQLSHECMRFGRMVESFKYKPAGAVATFSKLESEQHATDLLAEDTTGEAFANLVYATSNGNNQPGDGYRFRGRGFIQLTGRDNYKSMSDKLLDRSIDLVADPDRAAEPDIAARIAVAFWTNRKINAIADLDDVSKVTRIVNGRALKGLEDRRQLLEIARTTFYPKA